VTGAQGVGDVSPRVGVIVAEGLSFLEGGLERGLSTAMFLLDRLFRTVVLSGLHVRCLLFVFFVGQGTHHLQDKWCERPDFNTQACGPRLTGISLKECLVAYCTHLAPEVLRFLAELPALFLQFQHHHLRTTGHSVFAWSVHDIFLKHLLGILEPPMA
jgi:hypothetical protein